MIEAGRHPRARAIGDDEARLREGTRARPPSGVPTSVEPGTERAPWPKREAHGAVALANRGRVG